MTEYPPEAEIAAARELAKKMHTVSIDLGVVQTLLGGQEKLSAPSTEALVQDTFATVIQEAFSGMPSGIDPEFIVDYFVEALVRTQGREVARALLDDAFARPWPSDRERMSELIVAFHTIVKRFDSPAPTSLTAKVFSDRQRSKASIVRRLRSKKAKSRWPTV